MAVEHHSNPPFRRRGLSLERKLPLAACALLIVLLTLYTWIAYREVSASSRITAGERDTRMASELARLTTTSSGARARAVYGIVNTAAVREAMTTGDTVRLDSILGTLKAESDSSLTIVVFDAAKRPIRFIGTPPDAEVLSRVDTLMTKAGRRDSTSVSSDLFADRGRASFWMITPIRAHGDLLGYVAHLRPVRTTPVSKRTLDALIGQDNRILFVNRSNPRAQWVELDGTLVPAPERAVRENGYRRYLRDGKWYVAGIDSIGNSPFDVVVETPREKTQARAYEFLARIGLIGLLLLIIGTLIVWNAARSLTAPIGRLNAAAAAIGNHDYSRRVELERTDELGALADAFNSMASEIQESIHDAEGSRAQAEQANRSKSEFLANMSHEIRTPINAMLGYTDLIEAGVGGPVTQAQTEQLQRIKVSGRHLIRLIDDLLDFARMDTARLAIDKRVASAADAIHTAMTVIEPQAKMKAITITTDVTSDPQYVGDPQRVGQILVNLLGNAVKFTEPNGSVRLECRTITENGSHALTEFVVSDTGPGIPPNRVAHIFEPFVQGHTGYTRPHGGSGLGLTISLRLAELMDGTISVESEEGKGSRFTLQLPAPR